jgi:ABC-type uncharacterized transport system substrate-binding protein
MKRRECLSLLGLVVTWPLVVYAQQPAKVPRLGYLALRPGPTADDDAFKQGLRELGWIEGQNIAIEHRWAAGQTDRLATLAAELVRLQVDCIAVAGGTPVAQAAKAATQSIPIVMISAADPVRTGLVASLARPGGNLTGMASIDPELAGKHLELLRDLRPRFARVAFLAYGSDPAHQLFVEEAQHAAARLGMSLQPLVLGSVDEMDSAFAAMRSEQVEALLVQPLFVVALGQGQRIADLAVQHRLLTISTQPRFAELGGLMSYGVYPLVLPRRAATFVDKILKGAKPSDLPVEQPTKFKLVLNLKTAKALGLDVPPLLLATADEGIE